jgi:regulator of extracellular matrix RemA (YlzA/DUF370 family)
VSVEGRPWAVEARRVCPITVNPLGIGRQCIAFSGTVPSTHASQAITAGTRIIMLVRDSSNPASRVPAQGVKQVGGIVDIDTSTGRHTTTPVYIPDNRSSDSILVTSVAPEP